MNADWDIQRRGELCAKTSRVFVDNQVIWSRLLFGENGYIREDYAEEAWDQSLEQGALSVWKTVVKFPPPPAEESFKKENAESLLRQFITMDDFTKARAIYILGLMLERKKILVEKDVQDREDGTRIRIYEHKKTGEVFMIPDPGLKLSELEAVQEEVVVLLGGKSRQPAAVVQSEPAQPD